MKYMQEEHALSTVIGHIYEASYNPEKWSVVLEKIAKYTGAHSTAILYKNQDSESQGCSYSYNFPDEDIKKFIDFGVDPNFYLFYEKASIGTAAASDLLVPDRSKLEARLGEKYISMAQSTVFYHMAGGLLYEDDRRIVGIGVMCPKEMGPMNEQQIEKLDMLIPHLQRALIIQNELRQLNDRVKALHESLDRLLIGLILFDKQLKPIYINPVAKSILKYHPAIQFENGKISASHHEDTEKIHSALVKALSASTADNIDEASTSFGIKHHENATTLPVIISPVNGIVKGFQVGDQEAVVDMCFSDPERPYLVETDKLTEIFGLTKAEAQVATSMANGISPKDIATMNNVEVSTIRSQLKSIYQKMGVNTQAELVKSLLTGPFNSNI
jgi:DNA-binding CsgD family transcriptional regulator/PAS domain-containing protein